MFWNDPNLYSVAFKDVPNFPTPFYGGVPRFFHPYASYLTSSIPQIPPQIPQMFTPQMFTPQMFTPQVPYLQAPPLNPWVNPTLTPFNFTYFDRYRPFGL